MSVFGQFQQGFDILCIVTEVIDVNAAGPVAIRAQAVAAQVAGVNSPSRFCQVFCRVCIAAAMFRQAMHNEDDSCSLPGNPAV